MPPLKKVGDQNELVPVAKYPYATWKFENFNPVQSRIFEFYEEDCNALVSAATSAGKTVVSEMFGSHELAKRGGSFMYLCPMRALAKEKINDWTKAAHHFGKRKVAICTGDYRLTPSRAKELDEAEVVIMTSEMLNHRCRSHKSEQNRWISNIGTMCIDESHLLTVPGRGDHLEVGLMKFTKINKDARLVLLSATMPNVEQIAEWISYSLTKKETYSLRSNYRPCPLNIHYEKYDDSNKTYAANEQAKVDLALDIVSYYQDDKFLVFAHSIDTGHMMTHELKSRGIQCEFHYSLLENEARTAVEDRFRDDPKFRVVVATSTLAWGMNMPARRVIILGVHRGFDEVATYDINQMVGRSGRVGLDPMGDAYILLPETEERYEMQKARLKNPTPIISQLIDDEGKNHKLLAFHLISEIHHGDVRTKDDVYDWYERSLAHFQSHDLTAETADRVINSLKKCFAINEEDGELKATGIGVVASMFYYSPFDVSDLRRNFKYIFDGGHENDDIRLALALADVDSRWLGIVKRSEKDEMEGFRQMVQRHLPGSDYKETIMKAAYGYYLLLGGKQPPKPFIGFCKMLKGDFPRQAQVLQVLDQMSGKWGKSAWFNGLQTRISYGVKKELCEIIQIPNIGKVRATKLYNAGIRTLEDIVNNADKIHKLTGLSKAKAQEIVDEATALNVLG